MDVITKLKIKIVNHTFRLFFLFFVLSLASTAISQNKLEQKISIVSRNQPLASILKEIEQKSNLLFSYSNQLIKADEKLTIIARRKRVKDILEQLFSKSSIDYMLLEKQIILKPKRKEKSDIPVVKELPKPKKYSISGYLKDAETGEALIGATIALKNKATGTITNNYGYYSISLPQGIYLFQLSYIGYKNKYIEIELKKNQTLSETLELDETNLEVIVISAAENEDIHDNNPLKKINMRPLSQHLVKGASGENDFFQSIQSIPGINSTSDGSVFFYTRGGNKDQNLILVDEAPVYNPSHLFGIVSAISPMAINDVSIYKNYFPVQYGGRLSSVIDISIKDGNMHNFGTYGEITPFTTSLNFEGPIIKQKASYHLSFRNSHINWLNDIIKSNQELLFNDLHAKLNFKIGQKNKIYFSFYSGNDEINDFNTGIKSEYALKWQNFASTLRWNHLFSERLFSNFILYASSYDYYLYTSVEDDQYWNSLIGTLSLKTDFTYYLKPKNTIRFGGSLNSHYFNPGNLNDEVFSQTIKASGALQTCLYWGQDLKLFKNFSINYGIRFLSWNNIGPTTIYSFDDSALPNDTTTYPEGVFNTFNNIEPRIELLYTFNKTHSIQASYNHNIQYLHQISNSISPFTTLDIWMPSGPNIQPQQLDQFVIAYLLKLPELEFSAESYYKQMTHQIEYKEGANMLLNPYIENELRFGKSNSYGFELNLKKQKGKLTGLLNYSYSKTINNFNRINSGRSFPALYDKPHKINFQLNYKPTDRWSFNTKWVYTSGTRYSSPTGFYYYNSYAIPIYSKKNNSKLPDYHRLDIAASFRLNKNPESKYEHHLNFSIINVYGRKNIISVNFNKIMDENDEFVVPANFIQEHQVLPTRMYLLGVMPTISYQFSFKNRKNN